MLQTSQNVAVNKTNPTNNQIDFKSTPINIVYGHLYALGHIHDLRTILGYTKEDLKSSPYSSEDFSIMPSEWIKLVEILLVFHVNNKLNLFCNHAKKRIIRNALFNFCGVASRGFGSDLPCTMIVTKAYEIVSRLKFKNRSRLRHGELTRQVTNKLLNSSLKPKEQSSVLHNLLSLEISGCFSNIICEDVL